MRRSPPITTVALDLDGTLLDHEGRLSPGNAAALHRAQAQGVGIILATMETGIDEKGFLVPGFGDVGNRCFSSMSLGPST